MTSFIRPVKSKKISDTFADHKKRKSVNPGVDYVVPVGTPVFAIEDGVVEGVTTNVAGAGGRMIWLNCGGWRIDYLHLRKVYVAKGDSVTKGQIIGKSGASGLGSETGYGPHLHLSIRKGGKHVQGKGNKDFVAILAAQVAAVPATVAVESTPAQ